ncbi:hypothetical protein [Microvirga splendida]|uniref:DUF4148 domain-containing protein n=1 Tax=Microvirga splendida TaxID=2795727 RepID=A0ABS0Y487_9HYPH|nr:hypothetical protein [Microvirga splendida]MBJ6127084.1 hypothetical protein [Microvirga splendida]
MQARSFAALTTALIVSASATAYAQSGNQGYGQVFGNQNPSSGPMMQDDRAGTSRASQRAMLRQELRQAGFQNIRILDARFLVQAQTQNGDQIYMIVNPPGSGVMSMNQSESSTSSTGQNSYGFNTPTRYGSPRYTPPDAIPQFGNLNKQNNQD